MDSGLSPNPGNSTVRTDIHTADQILPSLQDAILRKGIGIPPWRATAKERSDFSFAVARVLAEERLLPSRDARAVAGELASRMMGLGLLEPFLRTEGVEEIIVRQGAVRVWQDGSIKDTEIRAPDAYFYALAQRAAEMGGKPLRAAKPFVLIDLPDGSRFTAMVPPLSRRGTAINIRVFSHRVLTLDQLVKFETLTSGQADYLQRAIVERKKSILISGSPGSGKTTLLNSLLAILPSDTQLCGAETFEEIETGSAFEARAVVREDAEFGRVSMGEVVNVLYTRMRPEVLVVGEVVNQEAREYIQAINLGVVAHTTIHGNSVLDALYRLEALGRVADVPLGALRESIARGVGLGIHLELKRDPEGKSSKRRVREVVEVSGDSSKYTLTAIRAE